MNRRHTAIAAAGILIALGVGAAGLLLSDGAPEETMLPSVPAKTAPAAPPVEPRLAPDPDATPIETTRFRDTEEPVTAEEEAKPVVALVVDDRRTPVAGATVTLLRPGGGSPDRGPFFDAGTVRDEPLRTLKSDAGGLAVLSPLPRRSLRIRARTPDALGVADFSLGAIPSSDDPLPEGVDVVVTLKPVRRLEVKVTDVDGSAVPFLRVTAAAPDSGDDRSMRGRMGRGGPFGGEGASAITENPSGVATLEITCEDEDLFAAAKAQVAATLHGLDRVEKTVDLRPAGTTRVNLDVPRTATVVLHLKDQAGLVVKDRISVRWWVETTGGGRGGFGGDMFRRSLLGRRDVDGGLLTIGGVATGLTLRCTTSGRDRLTETTVVAIPEAAWRHEADLLVGDAPPVLALRVLDAGGEPIADTSFTVDLRFDDDRDGRQDRGPMWGRGRGSTDATTDAAGRVRLQAEPDRAGAVEIRPAGGRRGGPMGMADQGNAPLARIAFGALSPSEKRDLGDARLPASALLAAGIVTDLAGTAVAGARVTVRQERRSGGGPGDDSGGPAAADSGQDGRFRIFGSADPNARSTIQAEDRGQAAAPLAFAPGAVDLTLVLHPTGGLAGRVRLADPSLPARLSVSLRASDPTRRPGDGARPPRLDKNGRFRALGLRAGSYDLEAWVNDVLAATVPGLVVDEGVVATPDSIKDLVVGQDFHLAEVLVQDQAGSPVSGAAVMFSIASAPNARDPRGSMLRADTDSNGRATRVLRRGDEVAISVRKDGLAPATIEHAAFPEIVVLTAGAAVVLRLPAPLPAAAGVRAYRFLLSAPASPGDSGSFLSGRFMGQDSPGSFQAAPGLQAASFTNVAPGRYQVRAYAERDGEPGMGRGRGRGPQMIDLGVIEVSAAEGRHELALGLKPAAFLDAFQQAPR